MDLASALQREVRKTSIIHECILVGSRKNSTDKPICRAGIEKQVDMGEKGREVRMSWESSIDIYTLPCVKQSVGSFCIA